MGINTKLGVVLIFMFLAILLNSIDSRSMRKSCDRVEKRLQELEFRMNNYEKTHKDYEESPV